MNNWIANYVQVANIPTSCVEYLSFLSRTVLAFVDDTGYWVLNKHEKGIRTTVYFYKWHNQEQTPLQLVGGPASRDTVLSPTLSRSGQLDILPVFQEECASTCLRRRGICCRSGSSRSRRRRQGSSSICTCTPQTPPHNVDTPENRNLGSQKFPKLQRAMVSHIM